jgi:hypothetical protein
VSRISRTRWDDDGDLLGRISRNPSPESPKMLVQIFDGGSMPTAADRVYLAHPVDVDGDEAERSSCVPIADTAQEIPVVVLGSPAVAGDLLVATMLDGRWVAQKRGKPEPGCQLTCSPCILPKMDLTVSWTNDVLGNGSTTLFYGRPTLDYPGIKGWSSGCASKLKFELFCINGRTIFHIHAYADSDCKSYFTECSEGDELANIPAHTLYPNGFSCNPLFLRYTLTNLSCPYVSSLGFTSFTVSVPVGSSPNICCATITVTGCNTSPADPDKLAGIDVRAYTAEGGTLLSTEKTDKGGVAYLTWPQGLGKIGWIEADSPFTGLDNIRTKPYPNPLPCGGSFSAGFKLLPGLQCIPCCDAPIPKDLYLTDDNGTVKLSPFVISGSGYLCGGHIDMPADSLGQLLPQPNCNPLFCPAIVGPRISGKIRIFYQVTCSGYDHLWYIARFWGIILGDPGDILLDCRYGTPAYAAVMDTYYPGPNCNEYSLVRNPSEGTSRAWGKPTTDCENFTLKASLETQIGVDKQGRPTPYLPDPLSAEIIISGVAP